MWSLLPPAGDRRVAQASMSPADTGRNSDLTKQNCKHCWCFDGNLKSEPKLVRAAAWDIFIATWCFQCVRKKHQPAQAEWGVSGQSSWSILALSVTELSPAAPAPPDKAAALPYKQPRGSPAWHRNSEQMQKMRQNGSKGNTSKNQQDSRKLSYLYYSCGWCSRVIDLKQVQLPSENISFLFLLSMLWSAPSPVPCWFSLLWEAQVGAGRRQQPPAQTQPLPVEGRWGHSQRFKVCQLSRR